MPGLVPGIHVFLWCGGEDVDGRAKPGHDGGEFVSRRMGRRAPSCFETPRHSASKTRVDALEARLLSMRAGEGGAGGRICCTSEAPTGGCRKRARSRAPCFRPVLYRELCNCSAWRGYANRKAADDSCGSGLRPADNELPSEEATSRCRKSSWHRFHCFRLFLTMEKATRACEALGVRECVIAGLDTASRIYPTCGALIVRNSGKPEFRCNPSASQNFLGSRWTGGVVSASTRVFDALLPAGDGGG
jgi:hypothetical protein